MSEHRKGRTARYLSPTFRRWLYGVALAGIALLVGYGVLTEDQGLLWAGLLVPVLGIALDNVTD